MANITVNIIYNLVYNMANTIVFIIYNLVYNMAAEGVNVKRKNGVQAAHGTAHLCILVILVVLVARDEHLYFTTGKTTTKQKSRPTKP